MILGICRNLVGVSLLCTMARRRTSRRKGSVAVATQNSPSDGHDGSDSDTPATPDKASSSKHSQSKEMCPGCTMPDSPPKDDSERDTWIRCDACKIWFHWLCAGEPEHDHENVGNWRVYFFSNHWGDP